MRYKLSLELKVVWFLTLKKSTFLTTYFHRNATIEVPTKGSINYSEKSSKSSL